MKLIYILAVMALLFAIPAVSAQSSWYGYNCQGYYGYGYSCIHDDNAEPKKQMDVAFTSSCDGGVVTNVITVLDAGDEAHVVVKQGGEAGDIITAGDTENDIFTFNGCDVDGLYIKVTQSGYARKEMLGEDTLSCSSCAPPPECVSDADCPSAERCLSGECVNVPCECGTVQNHQCVAYECCSDSQCSANELCQNHICNPKPAECTADAQCAADKYCNIPAGAAGGTCDDVTVGDCGQVENHAFVPYGYECGPEAGCPSCPQGAVCIDHTCKSGDVSCPTTGIVGDTKTCTATEGGQACANCDYEVTDPSGGKSTKKTDENGNFELSLDMSGAYQVTLFKDGQALKTIQVEAFKKSGPSEPEKPTAPDMTTPLLLLVFLLILLVLGILYWRSRDGKKK
ncbi:hypothetical protein H0O00_02790 [Candidatus Micrarchaeota archaeon]|nr:hypothetical protein [Candidatus Micrarchaeota archaeon]